MASLRGDGAHAVSYGRPGYGEVGLDAGVVDSLDTTRSWFWLHIATPIFSPNAGATLESESGIEVQVQEALPEKGPAHARREVPGVAARSNIGMFVQACA